jgi:hypothetical protein
MAAQKRRKFRIDWDKVTVEVVLAQEPNPQNLYALMSQAQRQIAI